MSTIAAISTPIGQGGIGIIRITGENAISIINKIFRTGKCKDFVQNSDVTTEWKSYTIKYGHIYEDNEMVDEVLVSYFKGPKSYTGEDVCEINCHGGNIVLKRILELVLKNGAKLAEPGEFTKRAFLNGKLDLSQAEAVMDIISSKSIKENRISAQQLEGFLGRKIKEIKDKIIDILVDIEANIDYPEYDVEEVQRNKINTLLKESYELLERLEKTFEEGKIIKEGINVVIVGKPNVGKSSLLNALLREDRAIVTDIAGTTRDIIEESIIIKGIPLKVIDTAGIRETNDVVEGIGVKRSKKAIEMADLVLMVLDATKEITEEDRELLELVKEKKHIILINKIDAGNKIKKEDIYLKSLIDVEDKNINNNENIVEISAQKEIGLERLAEIIEEIFKLGKIDINNELIITNARHKELIIEAKNRIHNVITSNEMQVPIDMLSIDLQNAVQYLGEITGETVSEEVINGIFKKFCLGK